MNKKKWLAIGMVFVLAPRNVSIWRAHALISKNSLDFWMHHVPSSRVTMHQEATAEIVRH
jgi:hypothetical protein